MKRQVDHHVIQQKVFSLEGGKDLLFAQIEDEAWYVSLAALCDALELTRRAQKRRIDNNPWLKEGCLQLELQTSGGKQRQNCLHLDLVKEWVIGLQPTRSRSDTQQAEDFGHRLLLYQELKHHFLMYGAKTVTDRVTADKVFDPREQQALLVRLPKFPVSAPILTVGSGELEAARQASLAGKTEWQTDPSNNLFYPATNGIDVYFRPIESESDIAPSPTSGQESAEITNRVLFAWYLLLRSDPRMVSEGRIAIQPEQVFHLKGIAPHTKPIVVAPEVTKRVPNGYELRHYEQLHRDVLLLQSYYLDATQTAGTTQTVFRGAFVDISYIAQKEFFSSSDLERERVQAYFYTPGAWFGRYKEEEIKVFTELDLRLFKLHPVTDKIALRLGLFLTARWAFPFSDAVLPSPGARSPWSIVLTIKQLLSESKIRLPEDHRTAFVARFQASLETLKKQKIVGEYFYTLPSIENNQYFRAFLETRIEIIPDEGLFIQARPSFTLQATKKMIKNRL